MLNLNNSDNNSFLRINIIPILSGICTLCIFSIILNIIEIKIIISLNFKHSILYRLLLLVSFSEITNCFFHIIQSNLIMLNLTIKFLYNINIFIIYFTDTFSLILLSCLCDSMNNSIIKQNKKMSTNQSYKFFSLIFSVVLTLIYFILYIINHNENYIYSEVISWKFLSNIDLSKIHIISTNFLSYLFTIIIYLLLAIYSFYIIIKIQIFIKEKSQEESNSKNWAKIKEFKLKMIKYPLYGALWVFPLIIYSLFEFIKKNNDMNKSEKINFLRIKFFLFFIYSFVSSMRGILFFKLFISNEKIKKYIQYKIKNIIFFENVLRDENSFILGYNGSYNDSYKIPEINNTNSDLYREGIIDDRDMKINDNEKFNDKNEDDSDSDDDIIEKKDFKCNNVSNTMPEKNNNPQSLSSVCDIKKENISYNDDKKISLKSSGFGE